MQHIALWESLLEDYVRKECNQKMYFWNSLILSDVFHEGFVSTVHDQVVIDSTVLECEKMFFPICTRGTKGHWWLVVYFRDENVFKVYDSFIPANIERPQTTDVINWYKIRASETVGFDRPSSAPIVNVDNVTQQEDYVSCGVHLMVTMERLVRGHRIEMRKGEVLWQRAKIALDFLDKSFLPIDGVPL